MAALRAGEAESRIECCNCCTTFSSLASLGSFFMASRAATALASLDSSWSTSSFCASTAFFVDLSKAATRSDRDAAVARETSTSESSLGMSTSTARRSWRVAPSRSSSAAALSFADSSALACASAYAAPSDATALACALSSSAPSAEDALPLDPTRPILPLLGLPPPPDIVPDVSMTCPAVVTVRQREPSAGKASFIAASRSGATSVSLRAM
mmetsp:Transcript_9903/g.32677  ORF Transcript_9903/g.32677 Transcript_9903/m.32677 type:complete len:212 (-) Transcript_9903:1998-2633(-)